MEVGDCWLGVGRMLAIGAAVDGAFGIAILALTRPAAHLLGLAVPDDPTYLGLNGVLLLILAGIYAAAAGDPRSYRLVPPLSAAGRGLGSLLFIWAWRRGAPPAFAWFALLDFTIGGLTFVLWRRAARVSD